MAFIGSLSRFIASGLNPTLVTLYGPAITITLPALVVIDAEVCMEAVFDPLPAS